MSGKGARPKHPGGNAAKPKGNRRNGPQAGTSHPSRRGGFGVGSAGPGQSGLGSTPNFTPYRRERPIGAKKLQDLLIEEPKEVLNTLTNQNSGFRKLLEEDEMKPDMMALALKATSKALDCTSIPQARNVLLSEIKKSTTFWTSCNAYVTSMPTRYLTNREEYTNSLKFLLKIFKVFLEVMPATCEYLLPNLLVLEHIVSPPYSMGPLHDGFKRAVVDDEIMALIEELKEDRGKAEEKIVQQKKLEAGGAEVDNIAPPENFREIPIFPVNDDVHANERPFLRANKMRGKYNDLEHYLDVQFRLLREDFMGPLRAGINDYLAQRQQGQVGRRRLENIKVYDDVQLLCPVCTMRGISYRIKFNVERLRNINWKLSKRLLYGGLICLSSDDFNTMLFATVCDRQVKDLEKGIVEVVFSDSTRIPETTDRFVMAESAAYFEAYRHVLKSVQNITEENFPFLKYIVECDTEKATPAYMDANTQTYDMTFICESARRIGEAVNPAEIRALRHISVMDRKNWPSEDLLKMDRSQSHALRAALTQEFCIIQGPPGTGKTFVGLNIVQTLLNNKQGWCPADQRRPILIVCYTNHALDQFIEGIMKFSDEGRIVRVGGRSQSEEVQKRSIVNITRRMRAERQVPRGIHRSSRNVRNDMDSVRKDIEVISVRLEATSRGLVRDNLLDIYFSDEHYDSLWGGYEKINPFQYQNKHNSAIVEWLGLGASQSQKQRGEGEEPIGTQVVDEEEDIEVDEDAEMITAERHLDDDADEKLTEDEKKRIENLERLKFNAEKEDLSLTTSAFVENDPEQCNDEQWKTQNKEKRRRKHRLRQGLSGTDAMTKEEAGKITDVWNMKKVQRWRLYRYWLNKYKEKLRLETKEKEVEYQQLAERYIEIGQELDLEIMRDATIIGMTTTGAARCRGLLEQIQPRVVIVEEAAEVLEAHLVTSISGGCEHFILIGDHKQLRPSPTVYDLAKRYHLDISLFERMINNGMDVVTLGQQHRMRPLISTLMHHIYPHLRDDESVHGRENIKGVAKDMFFIDHTQLESVDDELKSKSNVHEAKYAAALCRHLMLQGYSPSRITILTMYSGQLMQLKRNMPKNIFQGVRVTTVDNFQGEENDIIILSLVRSNTSGQIGFVASDNRICVALSRARLGFYCLGNFELFKLKSDLWKAIMSTVEGQGCKGNALPLFCQIHPDFKLQAGKPEDFDKAPEGGCMRQCEARLNCGHACPRSCHSYDKDHKLVKCKKPCTKILCNYGHECRKKCHEECGDCHVLVPKIVPICNHRQNMPCFKNPSNFCCREECELTLACGHRCANSCGEEHTKKCQEDVNFTWPCQHSGVIKCFLTRSPPPCPKPCKSLLQCEHPCDGTCGGCFQGRLHKGCQAACNRTLVCGHSCREPCTKSCPPCKAICQNRCPHSRCTKLCGQPCVPCKEPCGWHCEHYYCTQLCSEPCNRDPCDEPCTELLTCYHPCIGLCGEPCPEKCRICNKDEVTEIFFGTEDEEDARFVQLEDCAHVLEVTGLDHWMQLKNDKDTNAVEDQSIQLKVCPKCKTTIRRNLRYGTIINETLNDIEFIKEKSFGIPDQMRMKKIQIQDQLDEKLGNLDPDSHVLLNGRLDARKHMTEEELVLVENQVELLQHIAQLRRKIAREGKSFYKLKMRDESEKVEVGLEALVTWLIKHDTRISDQELDEFRNEVKRLSWILKFLVVQRVILTKNEHAVIPAELTSTMITLKSGKALTDEVDSEMKKTYQQLRKDYPDAGLAVTQKELNEIVKAVGLRAGHWFKCPNGHFYAIGECGGAMQTSNCPECNATIGGEDHRLEGDNMHAPEIDNSRHAAWSEAANLHNFDPNEFRF